MKTEAKKDKSSSGIESQNATAKSSSAVPLFIWVFIIPLILIILARVIWN
ncbi:MAG: hypothetical protein JXX14_25180 [Deltaproteobacteria bacterium]|nr:hypothetical protein [Deltaproteobacteria bacterium]